MELHLSFTTDHHFSHRPPGRRQGDYFADLSGKMEQVIDHCNSIGSVPLFGGDLFHLKDPSKISQLHLMKFLRDMAKLLEGFKVQPLCAVGNHDIRYDRLSTLPEQPLGLLAAAGLLKILCPYDPHNLQDWVAPSGHTHLVPREMPVHLVPTNEGSYIMVYSTPYMDDPQDLVAYLASDLFHGALAAFVSHYTTLSSVTGVLLLHTLAGPIQTEFFGLQRAAYSQIHAALSLSSLGRATSAVLFGHEHPEGGNYVLPIEKGPVTYQNLPEGTSIATNGTVYINPAAFSRSSIDYHEEKEDPDRPVYILDLIYTTAANYKLGLNATTIPLQTRPITQLFAATPEDLDPLNQEGVDVVKEVEVPQWTSFSDALAQLDQTGENPEQYLSVRLQNETTEVAATVKALLSV